jgi:hypothetical protein
MIHPTDEQVEAALTTWCAKLPKAQREAPVPEKLREHMRATLTAAFSLAAPAGTAKPVVGEFLQEASREALEYVEANSIDISPEELEVIVMTVARTVRDALLPPQPSADGRRVAWLIERKTADGARWYVEDERGRHDWTPDANFATSFATKAEAEDFPSYRMIAADPDISITEHVFIGAPQPSAALPGKLNRRPSAFLVETPNGPLAFTDEKMASDLAFGLHGDEGKYDGLYRRDGEVALVSQPHPEGEALTIIYTNWRGETAERRIIPIKPWYGTTEWHPDPGWLIKAWDIEKDAERDFAWSGIAHPAPHNEGLTVAIDHMRDELAEFDANGRSAERLSDLLARVRAVALSKPAGGVK